MSAIDAAIIKALVEHIGGNPDSIPEEAIDPNVLDYSKLEPLLESDACTWEIDDKGVITPDDSNPYLYLSVQIGDILLIKKKGENEITKSVCIKSGLSDKEGTTETQYYNFQSLTGSRTYTLRSTIAANGFTHQLLASTDYEPIDNVETGFFRFKFNNDSVLHYIQTIFAGISDRLIHIKNDPAFTT